MHCSCLIVPLQGVEYCYGIHTTYGKKDVFMTSVYVTRESRKFQSSQQTDGNKSVYVVRKFRIATDSYSQLQYEIRAGVGYTVLSIMCDEGNARAYGSVIDMIKQRLRLFIMGDTKKITCL